MKFIHEDATPRSVDALRILIFGLWLLIVIMEPLEELSLLPYSAFHYVGILLRSIGPVIGPGILSVPFLLGLKFLTMASLIGVLLNRYLIVSSVTACLLITIAQSLLRSVGHINHNELTLLYGAYFLTGSWVADALMKRNGRDVKVNLSAFPFIATLAVTSVTYSFIGLFRLVNGGVEIFTSDSLIHWIVFSANRISIFPWNFDYVVLQNSWVQVLLKGGFVVGTIFEALAPLCLVSHHFRRMFIAFMIPFHFVIFIFMHILFWEQLVLYILFFDIARPMGAVYEKLARQRFWVFPPNRY